MISGQLGGKAVESYARLLEDTAFNLHLKGIVLLSRVNGAELSGARLIHYTDFQIIYMTGCADDPIAKHSILENGTV